MSATMHAPTIAILAYLVIGISFATVVSLLGGALEEERPRNRRDSLVELLVFQTPAFLFLMLCWLPLFLVSLVRKR